MIKVKWEYLSIDQDKDLINTLGVDKFSTLKENEDIAMIELEDNTIVVYEIIPGKALRLKYASAESSLLALFLGQEAITFGAALIFDDRK